MSLFFLVARRCQSQNSPHRSDAVFEWIDLVKNCSIAPALWWIGLVYIFQPQFANPWPQFIFRNQNCLVLYFSLFFFEWKMTNEEQATEKRTFLPLSHELVHVKVSLWIFCVNFISGMRLKGPERRVQTRDPAHVVPGFSLRHLCDSTGAYFTLN